MAFEPTNQKMRETLQSAPKNYDAAPLPTPRSTGYKKTYSFTMTPDNREKLHEVATARGYTSDSAFLNDWVAGL